MDDPKPLATVDLDHRQRLCRAARWMERCSCDPLLVEAVRQAADDAAVAEAPPERATGTATQGQGV